MTLQSFLANLICGLALLLIMANASATEQSRVWNFDVFMDDKPIGYHRFTLKQQGALAQLKSETKLDVKFLFATVYRYAHDATESWDGDCLANLTARTDDNGKHSIINLEKEQKGMLVTTPNGRTLLPDCVMSFAYWNPKMLNQSRLLNPQTGKLEAVKIALIGDEIMRLRGADMTTKRYRITGLKNPIDLWYSLAGEWLALESLVSKDTRLRYVVQ